MSHNSLPIGGDTCEGNCRSRGAGNCRHEPPLIGERADPVAEDCEGGIATLCQELDGRLLVIM